MKIISRETDYAIRALGRIAKEGGGKLSAAALVKDTKVPRPLLRKVLQKLNSSGILVSYKGKGGGFEFRKNPATIMVADVMEVFQGKFRMNECVFVKKECPNKKFCRLRENICRIESDVYEELKKIRLLSLIP